MGTILSTESQEIKDGLERINARRRKTLDDPRSSPVSVMLQILELIKKLSFEQFSELDFLRGERNKVVHPNSTKHKHMIHCDPNICTLSFKLLLQHFLEADYQLKLTLRLDYQFYGIYDRE